MSDDMPFHVVGAESHRLGGCEECRSPIETGTGRCLHGLTFEESMAVEHICEDGHPRVLVTLHYPLDMGLVADILRATARKYPQAVLGEDGRVFEGPKV